MQVTFWMRINNGFMAFGFGLVFTVLFHWIWILVTGVLHLEIDVFLFTGVVGVIFLVVFVVSLFVEMNIAAGLFPIAWLFYNDQMYQNSLSWFPGQVYNLPLSIPYLLVGTLLILLLSPLPKEETTSLSFEPELPLYQQKTIFRCGACNSKLEQEGDTCKNCGYHN